MSSAQLKKFASVKPAEIEWRNGLPFSTEFDDVYFSIHGAVEESQHVFINGNNLIDDWKNKSQNIYRIAELGFGSGLNFFNTVQHWLAHQATSKINVEQTQQDLHYIAIEKRPFSLKDFKQSCLIWPEFSDITEQLITNYPSQTYGRHQIYFKKWNIILTLLFMPVEDALEDLVQESAYQQNKTKIDHWFLDGFAPTKNNSMWGPKTARQIAKLSRIGTRLATYSVAASVKSPLVQAGFKITKKKGFAKKREMLTAVYESPIEGQTTAKFINIKHQSPWFNIQTKNSNETNTEERIAIIGGGLAGCTTAYLLTQKGFKCDLFETRSGIAQAASGAAAGIFHPQLTSDMNINSQFNWLAYMSLLRFLSSLDEKESNRILLSLGVERFLESEKTAKKLYQLSNVLGLDHWIRRKTNQPTNNRSVFFPHSAVIDIAEYCNLLISKISEEQIEIKTNTQITDIRNDDQRWCLSTPKQTYRYQQIIFTGGAKSQLLDPLNITATNTTRGQTCYFQSETMAKKIKNTLCEQVYVVPRKDNCFHLGTTFDSFQDDQLNLCSQNELLIRTADFLKTLNYPTLSLEEIESVPLNGTVGYRLHSGDRLPIVGAGIDHLKLTKQFKHLGQSRILSSNISHYNRPGLWINTAYGSHGLLYSLLASQHLVALITNDISPINQQISNALHPARFIIRDLKSRKIN